MGIFRLLIADDDRELRRWVALALRPLLVARHPSEVVEAGDGAELIRCLLEEGSFDLLVSDIRMPLGSGLDAVRRAREAGIATPVILLSGFVDPQVIKTAEPLDRLVLLSKPVDGIDLLEQARILLEGPGRADHDDQR